MVICRLRPSTCSDAHSLSQVAELYKNAEAVQEMARLIGMDAPLGKAMLCPLPGTRKAGLLPRSTRSRLCFKTSMSAATKLAHAARSLCVASL